MTSGTGKSGVHFSGLTGPPLRSTFVELSESEYPDGLRQERHAHTPSYLTCVIVGGYRETVQRRTADVHTGALVFHPADEEHAVTFTADTTRIFRITPSGAMDDAARMAGVDLTCLKSTALAGLGDVVRALRAVHARNDPLSRLAADGLACELIIRWAGNSPRRRSDHRGAKLAKARLDAELNAPPSLKHLASHAGSHPVSLARAFRRTFGCSIGEYVRRRRLQMACDELIRGTDSISAIAARAGFADQAHFTRALRQAIGITPGALRSSRRSVCEPVSRVQDIRTGPA